MLSQCMFFRREGHRIDNNVKATLTFSAPTMRQMATRSIIALNTATAMFGPTDTVTDNHRNVRLAFGTLQKLPILKLKNNF
jgi:hypothetical protein